MLTEKRIRDLNPGQKTRIMWDSTVKGLGVRITPNGVKSYILNYRFNGRERRMTLARVGEITLRNVRERAAMQRQRVREGHDPLEQKREREEAPIMAEAMDRFFKEYVPERIRLGRMSQRTGREYRKQWRCYLKPKLARRKVAEVQRRHIETALAGVPPVTRNRLIALVSRLFNLFESWGLRPQFSNPARVIEKAREEPRDRVLSPSELGKLAEALNHHEGRNPAAVSAIRVAALTGLRIGEILAIRWEHVDFETGRLTLPETKTGRRQHDLPVPALDVLGKLPKWSAWVFSSTGRSAITYRTARKYFQEICAAADLENVRLHDLRRTAMTTAARSGIGVHVLRDLLGHRTTAMADRYVRAVGNPVREARELVGAEIAKAMKPEDNGRG